MGFFSDFVDNAAGSVKDVIAAPAKTISSVIDNPIVNPVGAGIGMVTGITPTTQLAIGGVVGAGIWGAGALGLGSAAAGGTAAAGGGIIAGGGGLGLVHEGIKAIAPKSSESVPVASPAVSATDSTVATITKYSPVIVIGLLITKMVLFK